MDCLYGQSIGLLLKIIDYLFHYDLDRSLYLGKKVPFLPIGHQ
ncbi:hypothetical protein Brsp07_05367 [Brucella sp. NBRC 14130]